MSGEEEKPKCIICCNGVYHNVMSGCCKKEMCSQCFCKCMDIHERCPLCNARWIEEEPIEIKKDRSTLLLYILIIMLVAGLPVVIMLLFEGLCYGMEHLDMLVAYVGGLFIQKKNE